MYEVEDSVLRHITYSEVKETYFEFSLKKAINVLIRFTFDIAHLYMDDSMKK